MKGRDGRRDPFATAARRHWFGPACAFPMPQSAAHRASQLTHYDHLTCDDHAARNGSSECRSGAPYWCHMSSRRSGPSCRIREKAQNSGHAPIRGIGAVAGLKIGRRGTGSEWVNPLRVYPVIEGARRMLRGFAARGGDDAGRLLAAVRSASPPRRAATGRRGQAVFRRLRPDAGLGRTVCPEVSAGCMPNCSLSVEPFMARVDAVPPVTTC